MRIWHVFVLIFTNFGLVFHGMLCSMFLIAAYA